MEGESIGIFGVAVGVEFAYIWMKPPNIEGSDFDREDYDYHQVHHRRVLFRNLSHMHLPSRVRLFSSQVFSAPRWSHGDYRRVGNSRSRFWFFVVRYVPFQVVGREGPFGDYCYLTGHHVAVFDIVDLRPLAENDYRGPSVRHFRLFDSGDDPDIPVFSMASPFSTAQAYWSESDSLVRIGDDSPGDCSQRGRPSLLLISDESGLRPPTGRTIATRNGKVSIYFKTLRSD
jgi:hypothetical protein